MNKDKRIIFVFFSLCLIFLSMITKLSLGNSNELRYLVYSVEFDYYGMDSKRIEEIITIPLEEKIMSLEGLVEMRSSCEYGKSITTGYFTKELDTKKIFLSLRSIVDDLYMTLPGDVQKPRIYSSSVEQKSILSVCVLNSEGDNTRAWVDNTLKQKFERIDGVSEVQVSGGKQKEVQILFENEKMAGIGQNPSELSEIVRDANSINQGGVIKNLGSAENVSFDTRFHSFEEMKDIPVKVGDSFTKLGYVADVKESFKDKEEIVRINGIECVNINLKSSSQSSNIKISKECRNILKQYQNENFKYEILFDSGKEQWKNLKSLLIALFESLISIILILPFVYRTSRVFFFVLLIIPLNLFWTISQLSGLGYQINENILSGMIISLGLIVDPVLVIGEIAENCKNKQDFYSEFKNTRFSILAASITSIIALVPLFFLEGIVPGIRLFAITVAIMICNSLVLSLFFLPVFIYSNKNISLIPNTINKLINRKITRSSIFLSSRIYRKEREVRWLYFGLVISPIFLFMLNGRNLSFGLKQNVIYCSVDYEPEQTMDSIDEILKNFSDKVKENGKVTFVKIESHKGNAEIEVGYDERKSTYKEIANYISSLDEFVSGGFLYVPENSKKRSRKRIVSIEIASIGDDIIKCRANAEKGAMEVGNYISGSSVVLNFKQPEKELVFKPNNEKQITNGINISQIAWTLRWILFGPVADKWIQNEQEIDIRIMGKSFKNSDLQKVKNISIPVNSGYVRLETLGDIKLEESPGKIYRKDGRRCVYFTVELEGYSLSKGKKQIQNVLKSMDLDRGYGFSFPREIEEMNRQYLILFFSLICCVAFLFLFLTFISENIRKSFLIITSIPVSCFIPILFRFIFGIPFELGDVIGMVILSGISINNAIYIFEYKGVNRVFCVRHKIKSIIVTTLTTIVSSIPLLLFAKDGFSKSLAFFMILGMIGSVVSIFLIPKNINDKSK